MVCLAVANTQVGSKTDSWQCISCRQPNICADSGCTWCQQVLAADTLLLLRPPAADTAAAAAAAAAGVAAHAAAGAEVPTSGAASSGSSGATSRSVSASSCSNDATPAPPQAAPMQADPPKRCQQQQPSPQRARLQPQIQLISRLEVNPCPAELCRHGEALFGLAPQPLPQPWWSTPASGAAAKPSDACGCECQWQ